MTASGGPARAGRPIAVHGDDDSAVHGDDDSAGPGDGEVAAPAGRDVVTLFHDRVDAHRCVPAGPGAHPVLIPITWRRTARHVHHHLQDGGTSAALVAPLRDGRDRTTCAAPSGGTPAWHHQRAEIAHPGPTRDPADDLLDILAR